MNEDKITIRVNIAERYYPITIARSEEESFRLIAKQINDLLLQFQQRYPNKDLQDYMAMGLLQYATRAKKMETPSELIELTQKMEQLNKTVEDFLVVEQVL